MPLAEHFKDYKKKFVNGRLCASLTQFLTQELRSIHVLHQPYDVSERIVY